MYLEITEKILAAQIVVGLLDQLALQRCLSLRSFGMLGNLFITVVAEDLNDHLLVGVDPSHCLS